MTVWRRSPRITRDNDVRVGAHRMDRTIARIRRLAIGKSPFDRDLASGATRSFASSAKYSVSSALSNSSGSSSPSSASNSTSGYRKKPVRQGSMNSTSSNDAAMASIGPSASGGKTPSSILQDTTGTSSANDSSADLGYEQRSLARKPTERGPPSYHWRCWCPSYPARCSTEFSRPIYRDTLIPCLRHPPRSPVVDSSRNPVKTTMGPVRQAVC
jgi:hypothetical protein